MNLIPACNLLALAGASPTEPGGGAWTLLIVYFVCAIGVSFFCSVWEAVLLSITQPYIAAKKEEGARIGAVLEDLKNNLNGPLTSILTLNTVAHTVGAMGVGAQVARLTGGGSWDALAGALMTIAILVFSEIIPKNLGAKHWRKWAPWVGNCLAVLTRIMAPFVKLIGMFAPGGHGEAEFNMEELRVMAELGRRKGDLRENEIRILQNLLRLRENTVYDVMTPRPVVFELPESMPVGEFMEKHLGTPFSRIPLFRKGLDDIVGFALKGDILKAAATGQRDLPLGDLVREAPNLPSTMPVIAAFEKLLSERSHIAMVLDEYGGFEGVVTLEDFFETLIGLEIVDEVDTVEDLRQQARELWKRRAERMGLAVNEFGVPEEVEKVEARQEPGNEGDD